MQQESENIPQELEQEEQINPDYVQMYYQHQYNRMTQLEEQVMQITNIVITLSIVAFTFGFDPDKPLGLLNGLVLPLMIILANIYAIGHIQRSRVWISTHRARARAVAEKFFKPLNDLSNDKSEIESEKRYVLARWGRRELMALLHLTLMSVSTVPIAIFYQVPRSITLIFSVLLFILFVFMIRKKKDSGRKEKRINQTTRSAQSIFIYGIYALLAGACFLFLPNFVSSVLGFDPPTDHWIYIVAILTIGLGYFYLAAARANNRHFFCISWKGRIWFAVASTMLVVLDIAPWNILTVAAVDLVTALWTAWALNAEQ